MQDFTGVDEVATFKDMDKESFTRSITVAAQRALIRDKESKDASTVSVEASPASSRMSESGQSGSQVSKICFP